MNKTELLQYALDELGSTYLTIGDDSMRDDCKVRVLKDIIDELVLTLGEELKHGYSTN